MIVIGLTGSIGMGKTTAARLFRQKRVPVFDADAYVHKLQAPQGAALPAIAAAFPGVVQDGRLDRVELGRRVFSDPAARQRLEAIVHPLVQAGQRQWLRVQRLHRASIVVLDIPLLFEGGGWRFCDVIAVVSAPARIQRQRVLARPGMTADKLCGILATQMPDREKRRRADVVLPTGQGKARTRAAIGCLLRGLAQVKHVRHARNHLRHRNHRA